MYLSTRNQAVSTTLAIAILLSGFSLNPASPPPLIVDGESVVIIPLLRSAARSAREAHLDRDTWLGELRGEVRPAGAPKSLSDFGSKRLSATRP